MFRDTTEPKWDEVSRRGSCPHWSLNIPLCWGWLYHWLGQLCLPYFLLVICLDQWLGQWVGVLAKAPKPYSAHHIEVSRYSRKYQCPSVSWDVALQGPVHLSLAKPRPIHAGNPGSYKSFRVSRPFVPSICRQEFEIELEGSQSLRILCYEKCYDKTKVNKDNNEIVDKIMGKGQIQVRSQGETWRAAGQGCTVEESFSYIKVETHSPRLAPWCVPAAHRYWSPGHYAWPR